MPASDQDPAECHLSSAQAHRMQERQPGREQIWGVNERVCNSKATWNWAVGPRKMLQLLVLLP